MKISKILLLLIVGYSFTVDADDEPVNAFNYINHLRTGAGMTAFRFNQQLSEVALNHASYNHYNRISGHFENRGGNGYTGYDHVARINAVGYLSRLTSENVSAHKGGANDKTSVDGLMSAIYHRFGFLSFENDEIGIGEIQDKDYGSFVYTMGNTIKNTLCSGNSWTKPGKYYSAACRNQQFRISAQALDKASADIQAHNPSVVVWPSANGEDIPPAFFEETPDPLPRYGVSGYPISIQFNPSVFSGVIPMVTRFELIDLQTGLPVELIKRMNKSNDQNNKFSEYEHAIFPLKRLAWSRQYRAEVDYMINGTSESLSWVFNTRTLNVPMYVVNNQRDVIKEKSGNTFAVYMPPKNRDDAELAYSTKYRGLSALNIKIIDGNTLQIKAIGSGDAEITFHGISFKVII